MTSLQRKLLDMMKWFHQFCVENELRYYVLGGTMLGAARHKGFIPWDDDIDIGMPRADYNKLEKIMGKNIFSNKYVIETPNTDEKDYYYPFAKIYDTETTLVENTRFKIKRGIYLDIFPLDGAGNNIEESQKNYKHIFWKYNLLLTRIGGVRKGRSLFKNLSVIAARLIPNVILSNKKILKDLVELCAKIDFDSSSWFGNMVGAWRFKEVMPKTVLGTPKLYEFEDIMVYGAENANEYLTRLYGNWRELPSEEKRKSHHDFIVCDLNKSYLL